MKKTGKIVRAYRPEIHVVMPYGPPTQKIHYLSTVVPAYKLDMSSAHSSRNAGINCWYNVDACSRSGPISRNSPSWQQQRPSILSQTNASADIGEGIVYKSSTVNGGFLFVNELSFTK